MGNAHAQGAWTISEVERLTRAQAAAFAAICPDATAKSMPRTW